MSIVEEYREWISTYDPTPPKPNKTYNKFFWWRRYQEHKFLPKMANIFDKAKNGDYDVSPYWKQIQYEHYFEEQELTKFHANYTGSYENRGWAERDVSKLFWQRRKRLLTDAERDEHARWQLLVKDLKTCFGGNEDDIRDMFESFEGTMSEFITAYRDSRDLPKIQPVPKF